MSDPDKYKYDKELGLVYEHKDEEEVVETIKKMSISKNKEKYRKKLRKKASKIQEKEKAHTLAGRKLNSIKGDKTLRATIYNDNDILGLAVLAESMNANSVFVPLKPVGLGKELKSKAPGVKRIRKVINNILTFNKVSNMEHRVEETYWYKANEKIWDRYKDTVFAARQRICESGINRLFVDYKGNVMPCFMLPNEDMGNILENDLKTVRHNLYKWDQKAMEIAKNNRCSRCLGGCMAVAKNNDMPENPCPFKVKS